MLGIIATIIAAIKGHKTFAWIIGIWSVIEIVLFLAKSPYAIGPGGLFVIIAIGMKNINKQEIKEQTSSGALEEHRNLPLSDPQPPVISGGDSENKSDITSLLDIEHSCMDIDSESEGSSAVPSNMSTEYILTTEDIESPSEEATLTLNNISPTVRYCRKCGFQLLDNSSFCSHCGTKVFEAEQI